MSDALVLLQYLAIMALFIGIIIAVELLIALPEIVLGLIGVTLRKLGR